MVNRLLTAAMVLTTAGCLAVGANASLEEDIRESISDNWKALVKRADAVTALETEMNDLPDSSVLFWVTDKNDQKAKIRKELLKARELLLSTTSQKIMKEIDAIDRDLAKTANAIRDTTEEKTLNPDLLEKCDRKLAELEDKKEKLEARRAERAKKVLAELRELGLNVSGEAAEQCMFTVNFDDLVDGVVVSRNIGAVVENLRKLMQSGSVDSARRYYGLYLTMVEVQVLCYEDYLEKSRTGEWRTGVEKIKSEAALARSNALKNAKDPLYTPDQQQLFAHNAGVNDSTIKAAEAYLKVLDAHEKIIAEKLATVEKVRTVVANSYETVNLAGAFLALAKSNQEAFDSLLQLDLPPIEMFDDAAVQQEFNAITRKLRE